MGVAMLSGMRSKDPNTQVGCCIVSQDNKILSMGYNGLPMDALMMNSMGEGRGRPVGDQICIYGAQRIECDP